MGRPTWYFATLRPINTRARARFFSALARVPDRRDIPHIGSSAGSSSRTSWMAPVSISPAHFIFPSAGLPDIQGCHWGLLTILEGLSLLVFPGRLCIWAGAPPPPLGNRCHLSRDHPRDACGARRSA